MLKNKVLSNLRTKFILSFLIILLIPFAAFGIITYRSSTTVIEKNVYTLTMQNIIQISSKLEYYIKDVEFITNLICNDRQVLSYLSLLQNPPKEYEAPPISSDGLTLKIISDVINLRGENLSGIYYLNNNSVYFMHPEKAYYMNSNNWTRSDWYTDVLNDPRSVHLIGTQQDLFEKDTDGYIISAAGSIQDMNTGMPQGIMKIDFDYDNFIRALGVNNIDVFSNGDIYILDNQDFIMYSNKGGLLTRKLDSKLSEKMKAGIGSETVNIDGKSMYMVYYTTPDSMWKIINIIPVSSMLKDISVIKNSMFILAFICILIILVSRYIISSALLNPINKLTTAMSQVEKGNFSVRISLKSHDEIGFLADSFNKMISNIDSLIKKVYHAQLKQKEAELYSLQSQINPHFLYNTLESIRGAALSYKIDSIAEMARCLSMLFRYNISEKFLVPIRDEVKNLDNYIKIQNFRHDNKFDINYNISEDILDYGILKLTLQPLVENSIKHGLEMKMGKGRIDISAAFEGSTIVIEIKDDGVGLQPKRLKELNSILEKSVPVYVRRDQEKQNSAVRIGINNVNSRIKLFFGAQYGLKYIPCQNGTIVKITIPETRLEE